MGARLFLGYLEIHHIAYISSRTFCPLTTHYKQFFSNISSYSAIAVMYYALCFIKSIRILIAYTETQAHGKTACWYSCTYFTGEKFEVQRCSLIIPESYSKEFGLNTFFYCKIYHTIPKLFSVYNSPLSFIA